MAEILCATCGFQQPAPRHAEWCPELIQPTLLGAPRAAPPFCYEQLTYQGVPISFDPTPEQMGNLRHHCRRHSQALAGLAWWRCFRDRERYWRTFDLHMRNPFWFHYERAP